MKKLTLLLILFNFFTNLIFSCEQKTEDNSMVVETIRLRDGTTVSKKRFKEIYAGLKDIFGDEAHRADDIYNIAFLKTLVTDKNRCVFGWDHERRKKLVYKSIIESIIYIYLDKPLIIDYVHSAFVKAINRFEYEKFYHPIVQEVLFDKCKEIWFSGNLKNSGAMFLVDKLDQYDIMRPVTEHPGAGYIDWEAAAILRAIIGQKSDKHFPYLKKPEEIRIYDPYFNQNYFNDKEFLKELDEIKFNNNDESMRSRSPEKCRIKLQDKPVGFKHKNLFFKGYL